MRALSEAEVRSLLGAQAELALWSIVSGKLHRELTFPDFATAIGFMTMSALAIERADHHPEWSNVYSRVVIDLMTHDANGITQRDLDLALVLEQNARRLTSESS